MPSDILGVEKLPEVSLNSKYWLQYTLAEKDARNFMTVVFARLNPFALRTAKTLWRFGYSECNRVKGHNSGINFENAV